MKNGVGFGGLLGLLLIGLKLTGTGEVATWGWGWVLSPLWLWPVIVLVLAFSASGVASLSDTISERRRAAYLKKKYNK